MPIKLRVLSVITFTALSAAQTVASAAPVRPASLDELVEKSTVVATGFVTSHSPRGGTMVPLPGGSQIPGRTVAAEIAVSQILKGPVDIAVLNCVFVVPDAAVGFRPLPSSRDILVFLVPEGDHLKPTNPYFPFLPSIPVKEVHGPSPLDRVVAVLDAVLDSPDATTEDKRELLFFLPTSSSPSARAALRKRLGHEDVNIRLWAAAGLTRLDDVAALKVTADALLDPPPLMEPGMTERLNAAVASGIRSPGAIPTLARLLAAKEVDTRRAAASAVSRTASRDAIPLLVSALSDPDVDVQYWAVKGLSEITGAASGTTSLENFRKDPTSYVARWKRWAKAR